MSPRSAAFAPPFTPSGEAWVAPPLPYRVAHNVLQVLFKADPAALARLLPAPFEPADDRPGIALAVVLDAVMSWGDESDRFPPEYHQGAEAFLIAPCRYRGEPGKCFAAVYADRDWLQAAATYIGMPAQVARIQLTRLHPLHPTLGEPRPDLRLQGGVQVAGRPVLSAAVTLVREVDPRDLPLSSAEWTNYGLRAYPGLRDVVVVETEGRRVGPTWEGQAELDFDPAGPLAALRPVEVITGHWTSYAYTLTGVRKLGDG